MQTAVIAPTKLLSEYSARSHYHLCLCHLILEDPEYAAFYAERSRLGDFVILDNSAHEGGRGNTVDLLLNAAEKINPNEIVLPDRLFFAQDTLREAESGCVDLRRVYGTSKRLMVVPQGRTEFEWDDCCEQLIQMDIDTIGLSKDFETWAGGLIQRVKVIRELALEHHRHDIEIHLLGWGRNLVELVMLARLELNPTGTMLDPQIAPIRGIDSAKPLVFAFEKIPIDILSPLMPPYPGRPRDYFESDGLDLDHDLADFNLCVFEYAARGIAYQRGIDE